MKLAIQNAKYEGYYVTKEYVFDPNRPPPSSGEILFTGHLEGCLIFVREEFQRDKDDPNAYAKAS